MLYKELIRGVDQYTERYAGNPSVDTLFDGLSSLHACVALEVKTVNVHSSLNDFYV